MTSKRKPKEAWAMNGFEEWGGYMAAKKAKLDEQFHERAATECKNTSNLFQGICIFVNGYTKPSSDELRLLMMRHNGVYHYYMRPRSTTHIIASNLPYSKIIMYKKSQNPLPICKPEWITDSLEAGRLLNYQDYLLYSHHTKTQPKLAFAGVKSIENGDNERNGTKEARNLAEDSSSITKETLVSGISESVNASKIVEGKLAAKESTSGSINSTKNPEFLSEFYNNSRLHHISTMGATFKDYINELRDKSDKIFPGFEKLKESRRSKKALETLERLNSDSEDELFDSSQESVAAKKETIVMHIDMDCFFVSVGLRNRPELKGLPVAVTHAKGSKPPQNAITREKEMKMYKERREERFKEKFGERSDGASTVSDDKVYENSSLSEIASCSYEARKAGIKNGMFLGQALKLCPELKTIPYDFEGYKEVSYALYDTVASYTLDIEAVSCDEMYADCTKIIAESGLEPLEFAGIIRRQITEKTGCPVSTGFGKNKLQARLATKKAKPNGQFHLESKNVQRYMSTISTRDLPGVGPTITNKLNLMGVHTCAELQSVGLGELQKELGKKTGELLYNMCRGIDNSKLSLEHVRKSVSTEVNYGIRFDGSSDAENFLKQLSEEVCTRLNKANSKGRCVTLKMMIRSKNAPVETAKYMGHGFCDNITRSKNLISAVNDPLIITKEVLSLWNQLQQIPKDVRGVGIQISRLESTKKSGSSSLMSFINKAKERSVADNKSINGAEENGKVKEFKNPESMNGSLLIPKNFSSENKIVSSSRSIQRKESAAELIEKDNESRITNDQASIFNGERVPEKNAPGICEKNPREDNLMHDIDESVLAELPEEIRKEIIAAAKNSEGSRVENDDKNPPLVQKKQDSYFKKSKRNVERAKKSEMPPIQEVDLAVLLELPDDIRNEILNEYRSKANDSKQPLKIPESGVSVAGVSKARSNILVDEADLSISQVDPEVLAALPKDIQNDVKEYCASKKMENRSNQTNTNKNLPIIKQFGTATSKSTTINQKITRQVKAKAGGAKINNANGKSKKNLPSTSNNKNSKRSPEPLRNPVIESGNSVTESVKFHEPKIFENRIQDNSIENIEALSSTGKSGDPEDQKTVLKLLVEEFMSLSLKEVKLQIQNWISTSDNVNKVDFLAFTTFLSSLPKKRRIEDLHVLLKTMHRCIEKTGVCIWHRAYNKAIELVQRHMLANYDSSLMVPIIKCDNFYCRNNNSEIF